MNYFLGLGIISGPGWARRLPLLSGKLPLNQDNAGKRMHVFSTKPETDTFVLASKRLLLNINGMYRYSILRELNQIQRIPWPIPLMKFNLVMIVQISKWFLNDNVGHQMMQMHACEYSLLDAGKHEATVRRTAVRYWFHRRRPNDTTHRAKRQRWQ